MSKDTVKLFQRARAALQSEKNSLLKALEIAQATAADAKNRLADIEGALGGADSAPGKRRGRKPKKAAGKRRGRPAKKKASTKVRTLTKKVAKKSPKKVAKKVAKKSPKKVAKKVAKKAPKTTKKKAAPKRAKNERSLKDFVLQETKNKTLKLAEIAVAVQKAGYKSKSKNLKNSIAASVLYNTKNKNLFKKSKDGFTAA